MHMLYLEHSILYMYVLRSRHRKGNQSLGGHLIVLSMRNCAVPAPRYEGWVAGAAVQGGPARGHVAPLPPPQPPRHPPPPCLR